jgi:DNA gyrase subunit B
MVDPQFTSQSKVKLGSTIARTLTDKIVSDKLGTYLEENPKVAQSIIQKNLLAMKARLAARAARESVIRKGVLESMALPGKLADCSEKDPAKSEIFIVEGESAGGSAKQGRDRHTQAILALRGKVLNTEKATLDRIMNYEGIKNMILAFGTGVGDKFDVEKLRYHKIVLMTDADVDGAHITTLLLTFLYRYMPRLIEDGYIYMARPPLYKIKSGKFEEYTYSDLEKEAMVKKIVAGKPDAKIEIQRYKGLGEMNPEQLWETTMDPSARLLWQVTIGEAQLADQVFDELMGADVEPRRKFIEENAMFVEDLDVV